MIVYLTLSMLVAASAFLLRSERQLFAAGAAFYAVQAAFAAAKELA